MHMEELPNFKKFLEHWIGYNYHNMKLREHVEVVSSEEELFRAFDVKISKMEEKEWQAICVGSDDKNVKEYSIILKYQCEDFDEWLIKLNNEFETLKLFFEKKNPSGSGYLPTAWRLEHLLNYKKRTAMLWELGILPIRREKI